MRDLPIIVENPSYHIGDSNSEVVQPVSKSVKKSRRMTFTRKGGKKAQEELRDNIDSLIAQENDLKDKIRLIKDEYDEIEQEKEKHKQDIVELEKKKYEAKLKNDEVCTSLSVNKDRLAEIDEFKGMDIEAEIKKLEAEKKTLESVILTLQKDKDGLLQQVSGLEKRKKDTEATIKENNIIIREKVDKINEYGEVLTDWEIKHEQIRREFYELDKKYTALQSLIISNPHVEEYLKPKEVKPDDKLTMSKLQGEYKSRVLLGIKKKIQSFVPSCDEIMTGCIDGNYTFMKLYRNYFSTRVNKRNEYFNFRGITEEIYGIIYISFKISMNDSIILFKIDKNPNGSIDIDKKKISIYYIIEQIKKEIQERIPDVEFKEDCSGNATKYMIVCSD